jgi:hypothetical protein
MAAQGAHFFSAFGIRPIRDNSVERSKSSGPTNGMKFQKKRSLHVTENEAVLSASEGAAL